MSWIFLGGFLLISFLLLLLIRPAWSWRCLCVFAITAGGFLYTSADITMLVFKEGGKKPVALTGRIVEVQKGNDWIAGAYVLDHVRLDVEDQLRPLRGKVRVEVQSGPGLREGDLVAVRGRPKSLGGSRNPSQWDWETHAKAKGIRGRVFVGRQGQIEVISHNHFSPWERMRRAVRQRWSAALEMPSDALAMSPSTLVIKGMILGERSELSPEIRESFLRTNTFHILAISGQQMMLIFMLLFGILRALGVSQKATALVCIPIMLLYGSVVGWMPSVARSVTMMILVLIGFVFDRKVRILRMLSLAAIYLLLRNPHELFDIGFQLSFLVVLFLIVFTQPILHAIRTMIPEWDAFQAAAWKRFLSKLVLPLFVVSLVAWMATAPLTASRFNWFCPITLIANLFIVGWVSVLTIPLGFVSLIAGSIWIPLAYPFNVVNGLFTEGLLVLTKFLGDIPYGSMAVRSPATTTLPLYYALVGSFGWVLIAWKKETPLAGLRRMPWVAAPLLVLMLLGELVFARRLECVFFDVGQGDAIFVRFPNGKNMLVDAGPGRYGRSFEKILLPYMRSIGAKRIDYLVMNHPHADHIGGMSKILESVEVGTLMGNGRPFSSLAYRQLLRAADKRHVGLEILHSPSPESAEGRKRIQEGAVSLEVLSPPSSDVAFWDGNENEHSLVLALKYAGRSLLLTGDIERRAEAQLLETKADLVSDVLKVAHHGGATSSSANFLDAVAGQWAIISVGRRNRFGHPRAAVLERLRSRGWNIFRTDQDGAVVIRGYGRWWNLRTIASKRYAFLIP